MKLNKFNVYTCMVILTIIMIVSIFDPKPDMDNIKFTGRMVMVLYLIAFCVDNKE